MSKFKLLKIKQNNFNDYRFNIHINKSNFIDCIINDFNNDKKLWISSTYKSTTIDLFKLLVNECYDNKLEKIKEKRILLINGDSINYFNNSYKDKKPFINNNLVDIIQDTNKYTDNNYTIKLKNTNNHFSKIIDKIEIKITDNDDNLNIKNDLLENLEDYIINKYKCDIVITSPTITSGISINKPYFNKSYNFGLYQSLPVREFIQMLFRNRNLIDKVINIFLDHKYREYLDNIELDKIRNYIKYTIENKNKIKLDKKNKTEIITIQEDLDLYTSNQNYMRLREINIKEKYDSLLFYIQQFFNYMIDKHDFKLNKHLYFIDNKTDNNKEIKEKLTNIKNERLELKIIKYLESNILDLDYQDILEIKELLKNNETLTEDNYRNYNKYKKTMYYFKYEPIIAYFFFKDLYNNDNSIFNKLEELINNEEITDKIELLKLYDLLKNKKLVNNLISNYQDIYNYHINTENHLDKYYLHLSNTEIQNKYSLIDKIIKLNDNNKLDNNKIEYDFIYTNDKDNTIDINITDILLKYLDIDIKNIDIKSYHFINEYSNKKPHLKSLRYDILINKKLEINNTEYNLLDFINNYILIKDNQEIIKKLKIKNNNKLDNNKNNDYKDIHTILKYYLLKVNLELNYNITNYFYKTTEIIIKMKKPIIKLNRDNIKKEWIYQSNKKLSDNRILEYENIINNYKNENTKLENKKLYNQTIIYDTLLENKEDIIKIDNNNNKIIYTNKNKIKYKKYGKTDYYLYDNKKYRKTEMIKYIIDYDTLIENELFNNILNNICNDNNNDLLNRDINYTKKNINRYVLKLNKLDKKIINIKNHISYKNEDTKNIDIDSYDKETFKTIFNNEIQDELYNKTEPNINPIITNNNDNLIYEILDNLLYENYNIKLNKNDYDNYLLDKISNNNNDNKYLFIED